MALGRKTGGRQVGTPNKATADVKAKLAAMGADPIRGMALIAMGEVPCVQCKGGAPDCPRCHGTGQEPISAELQGRMWAELAKYVAPQMRSTETKIDGELRHARISDAPMSVESFTQRYIEGTAE
jgi:hypothetical protein